MAIQSLNGTGGQPVVVSQPGGNVPSAAPAPSAPPPPQPAAQQRPEPSQQQLQQALNDVQQKVKAQANNLEFSLDKETGQTIVKVTDAQTGDVIRQIPAQEFLDIAHAIDQMQGVLLKQQA